VGGIEYDWLVCEAGVLQWRVLADNLPTSGSFEWRVPDGCAQGSYLIQVRVF
jgi:hypothetical protein